MLVFKTVVSLNSSLEGDKEKERSAIAGSTGVTRNAGHAPPQGPTVGPCLQGYLAHKKLPPARTLQYDYSLSPTVVLGKGTEFQKLILNEDWDLS